MTGTQDGTDYQLFVNHHYVMYLKFTLIWHITTKVEQKNETH